MATAGIARSFAVAVGKKASSGCWFTPHMAAAARAIADRIPLVDLVLEIRDARVPLSSKLELRSMPRSSKRVIILNKIDLANQSKMKDWMKYFDQQNCISFGVNAHNEGNIKELLTFLQAKVRELMKTNHSDYTVTVMLVGIPNVGKSALANSLHQVGRISAEEKGKLKPSIVSPLPGETKSIRSMKIGSHPSIYVLDTPGILSPRIPDAELCSKLALIGTIRDCLIGEIELAHYFLAILYSSNKYKRWANLSTNLNERSDSNSMGRSDSNIDKKMQRLSDHTKCSASVELYMKLSRHLMAILKMGRIWEGLSECSWKHCKKLFTCFPSPATIIAER